MSDVKEQIKNLLLATRIEIDGVPFVISGNGYNSLEFHPPLAASISGSYRRISHDVLESLVRGGRAKLDTEWPSIKAQPT